MKSDSVEMVLEGTRRKAQRSRRPHGSGSERERDGGALPKGFLTFSNLRLDIFAFHQPTSGFVTLASIGNQVICAEDVSQY